MDLAVIDGSNLYNMVERCLDQQVKRKTISKAHARGYMRD